MQPGRPFARGLCSFGSQLILLSLKSGPMSTIVHEFFHYLLYILYDNESYPYTKNDMNSKAAFSKAYEKCEIENNRDLRHLNFIDFQDGIKSRSQIEWFEKIELIIYPATIPID